MSWCCIREQFYLKVIEIAPEKEIFSKFHSDLHKLVTLFLPTLPVPNFNSLGPHSQTQIYSTLSLALFPLKCLCPFFWWAMPISLPCRWLLSQSPQYYLILPHHRNITWNTSFMLMGNVIRTTPIEFFPCDIHYSKHLTCITFTGLPNNLK